MYERVSLDPKLIEDVSVGNVLPPGGGASAARMAALYAGIPNTSALNTVNRQCSSGLTAVNQIANEIRAGQIDIGIGMSLTFIHSRALMTTWLYRCWCGINDQRVRCRCTPGHSG